MPAKPNVQTENRTAFLPFVVKEFFQGGKEGKKGTGHVPFSNALRKKKGAGKRDADP